MTDPRITEICPHCGQKIIAKTLSDRARLEFDYMRKHAPARGGYIFEGARPKYEAGAYHDNVLAELLAAGLIVPHADPAKGRVVADA